MGTIIIEKMNTIEMVVGKEEEEEVVIDIMDVVVVMANSLGIMIMEDEADGYDD
ncbi:hypothetical protein Hdeb2414_s0033g00722491 [Helianthus debilis subsp. tardiflorus]